MVVTFCFIKNILWHIYLHESTEQKIRHETNSSGFCSLHAVTSSVIYYSTHTWENVIYLFYTIKIQMVYSARLLKDAAPIIVLSSIKTVIFPDDREQDC